MGLRYKVSVSDFAEDLCKSDYKTAGEYARATALAKANAVRAGAGTFDLLVAGDTVVEVDGSVLEKPGSEGEAVRMLTQLCGRAHRVVTAVCVMTGGGVVREFGSEATVWFDDVCGDAVAAYVRTGEPMDKAGAYGIQGLGGAFVARIDGCFFAVMGLPMHALAKQVCELVDDGLV